MKILPHYPFWQTDKSVGRICRLSKRPAQALPFESKPFFFWWWNSVFTLLVTLCSQWITHCTRLWEFICVKCDVCEYLRLLKVRAKIWLTVKGSFTWRRCRVYRNVRFITCTIEKWMEYEVFEWNLLFFCLGNSKLGLKINIFLNFHQIVIGKLLGIQIKTNALITTSSTLPISFTSHHFYTHAQHDSSLNFLYVRTTIPKHTYTTIGQRV